MIGLLKISDVVAQLKSQLDPSVKVGSGTKVGYWDAFPKTFPAVWITGRRMTPLDEGADYTEQFRQHFRAEIRAFVVVQRAKPGVADNEDELNALFDAVVDALKDWHPPNFDTEFVISAAADGSYVESILYAEIKFSAQATYARP